MRLLHLHLPRAPRLSQRHSQGALNAHRAILSTSAARLSTLAVSRPPPSHRRHCPAVASLHTTSPALTRNPSQPLSGSSSAPPHEAKPAAVEIYSPPTTGLLAHLPKSWLPYAELIRLDKPTGTYYLYFPCLFSTLMAAPMALPMASPGTVLGYSALFFAGALVMRGAGCTINDLLDRNLDPHVTRTKFRPIARGAITPFKGLVYTGAQLLTGLAILVQFPTSCLYYGIPSLLLVSTYPLAKRITHYPQLVLGFTFSWGAIMGFPALGIDLLTNSSALVAATCLYASNISWTVLYDMIYAHMDRKDDVKIGIKSIAVKHDAQTKAILTGLGLVQVGLLGAAGVASGAGPLYFLGSCGGTLVALGVMIRKVNLKSVKDCWWWFVNGCWITGGTITLGLTADYLARYLKEEEREPVEEVE
jgi:4-hydroxybenzoate polyprenyltransferase